MRLETELLTSGSDCTWIDNNLKYNDDRHPWKRNDSAKTNKKMCFFQALPVQTRWNITNVLHDVTRIPFDLQHGVLSSPAPSASKHVLPTCLQPEETIQALQLEMCCSQCHPHLSNAPLSVGLLHWWVTSHASTHQVGCLYLSAPSSTPHLTADTGWIHSLVCSLCHPF